MRFEDPNADPGRTADVPGATGVPRAAEGQAPGALDGGDGCGGWDLVHRDWSVRQREPLRLRAGLAAVRAWVRRVIRAALRSRLLRLVP